MIQIRNNDKFYINKCIIKIKSNDKSKETDITNRTWYWFDDIIKIEDFDLDNILIDKKSNENILVYNIPYKNLIDSNLLSIRFYKINGFIRIYDGNRYLVLFGSEKYGSIYNRIWYLISVKSGIPYIISHYYAKSKVDSYDFLPLEKAITFHNVVILIKPVINKDKNNCYYNILLEKVTYELPTK